MILKSLSIYNSICYIVQDFLDKQMLSRDKSFLLNEWQNPTQIPLPKDYATEPIYYRNQVVPNLETQVTKVISIANK